MKRALLVPVFVLLGIGAAHAAGLDPLTAIAGPESSYGQTLYNPTSSATGIFQDITPTWDQAITAIGYSPSQYPSAASAPASIQFAANAWIYNTQGGFNSWTIGDPTLAANIQAAGGSSAFAAPGTLSTNPATYAGLDQSGGLQAYFANAATGTQIANNSGGGTATVTTPTGTLTVTSPATGTAGPPGATGAGGVPQGNILDSITEAFQTATGGWNFSALASGLFFALAGIDIFFAYYLEVAANGAVPEFGTAIWVFVRWAVPIGSFLAILLYGPQIAQAIISTPRYAASVAGAPSITPSSIFAAGIDVAGTIWQQLQATWNPVWLLGLWFSDILIAICFVLCAAWMAIAVVESYFIVGASTLYLAFGGLRWTRHIAINLLGSCLAIGFKLFGIAIIVTVGQTFINQWTAAAGNMNAQQLLIILGSAIFMCAAAKFIPDKLERIVLGATASMAQVGHVTSAAKEAAALAAAPVLFAIGELGAAITAAQLAATEVAAKGSDGGDSARPSKGQIAASAAGHYAAGHARDLGRRWGSGASGGQSGFRVAEDLANRRRMAEADQARPRNNEGSSQ
jgi:type IV secretion system protein TrbL